MNTAELKRFLLRGWLTHDAMWFKTALNEVGTEKTMKINRGAIRAMAPIEVGRILEVLGMTKATCLEELEAFMTGAMELLGGDFMQYEWEWHAPDKLVVKVSQCFAHKGIGRLGVLDDYLCGPFDRIYAWFSALGVSYQVIPTDERCTMHHRGQCMREIRFGFQNKESSAT